MIYTHIIAMAFAAALAFAGAWKVQENRFQHQISGMQVAAAEEKADRQAALIAATETARLAEQALSVKYQGALNEARTREIALRRDVDAARSAADSLRDQASAAARALASASPATIAQYADTAGQLLAECSREYQALGAAADGHVQDLKAIIGAWPINPPR